MRCTGCSDQRFDDMGHELLCDHSVCRIKMAIHRLIIEKPEPGDKQIFIELWNDHVIIPRKDIATIHEILDKV